MGFASLTMIATALIIAFGFVAYNSRFLMQLLGINSRKLVQTKSWLVSRHENLVEVELEDLEIQ